MLVEDEAITALDLQTRLEELGYEVFAVVSNGADAVRIAGETSPELILMDINLNGTITGIAAAEQIRMAQKIPVVFLTAHQDSETMLQAITAEPFGYLTKPCNQSTLKNTIEVALHKSAADSKVRDAEERLRLGLEQLVAERTSEFDRINQELAEFCYAISHELRAPIARLQGMSAVLLEECSACPKENPHNIAERIHHASLQQRKVVDAILALARISRIELQLQEVDLSTQAVHIIKKLLADVPQHEISIAVTPGIKVLADPGLMHVCLQNLLSNAVKFTAHKGDARIEFGRDQQDGEEIYFVRDNGAGFNMKYVDKLFVPFQRLHKQDEFSGTGIGLATVCRIVKRHGGRIWANAERNKGATFFFSLPC